MRTHFNDRHSLRLMGIDRRRFGYQVGSVGPPGTASSVSLSTLLWGEDPTHNVIMQEEIDGLGHTNRAYVNAVGQRLVDTTGQRVTYRAGIIAQNLQAAPTDVFTIASSSTKTVEIRRIAISGGCTTATQMFDVQLLFRSTLDTNHSGTTTPTSVPVVSTDPAATAVLVNHSAGGNPTALGTLVGILGSARISHVVTATANPSNLVVWEFGTRGSKPLTLQPGGTEQVAVNYNGATLVNAPWFDLEIEYLEY
jgi:hypothetical protein